MRYTEYKRLLFHLFVTRSILPRKPWLSVGRQQAYAHFLAYSGERAWKVIHVRRRWPLNLNRIELCRKSRERKTGIHFTNRIQSACTSLVRHIPEYRAACIDPFTERQINAVSRVQTITVPFARHTKNSGWENVAQPRTKTRLCALYKAHSRERAWNVIHERMVSLLEQSRSLSDNLVEEARNGYRELFFCKYCH